jgi:hypothetical protein
MLVNNIIRPYKKFEVKIQKKCKLFADSMARLSAKRYLCRQHKDVLSAKLTASVHRFPSQFFADRISLPTTTLSVKISFADSVCSPTAGSLWAVVQEFFADSGDRLSAKTSFADSPGPGCRQNVGLSAKFLSPVVNQIKQQASCVHNELKSH